MTIRPEDILPDNQNTIKIGDIIIRKGTFAAAVANAEILESDETTEQEKVDARNMLKELAPALVAGGLQKHLIWKNAEIQKIMDECKANIK